MSKERELLKRWLAGEANQIPTHLSLLIETQNLLAQPEQEPEPEPLSGKWWYGKGVEDTKYFLKREPLSEDDIRNFADVEYIVCNAAFISGVKWAEKQHGIGVDDE